MPQSWFVSTNTHMRTYMHMGTHVPPCTQTQIRQTSSFVLYANLMSGVNIPQSSGVISFAHALYNLFAREAKILAIVLVNQWL